MKDGSYYIGSTSDIDKRLQRHNSGWERYTRTRVPWKLVWKTEKPTRGEAQELERKIKNKKSKKRIEEFIKKYPQESAGPAVME